MVIVELIKLLKVYVRTYVFFVRDFLKANWNFFRPFKSFIDFGIELQRRSILFSPHEKKNINGCGFLTLL